MLSYYAEMATADGLVCLIASHTAPWVAPEGASEGRFGTNPI
jgi:LDH2 family malate/lactate/ureidoglycolate dehydrogenase